MKRRQLYLCIYKTTLKGESFKEKNTIQRTYVIIIIVLCNCSLGVNQIYSQNNVWTHYFPLTLLIASDSIHVGLA